MAVVAKEIKLIDDARKDIVMGNFNGDLDNREAALALIGLEYVLNQIDKTKAPVLKPQAVKLRQLIDANITKITGEPFSSTPAEEEETDTADAEAAAGSESAQA